MSAVTNNAMAEFCPLNTALEDNGTAPPKNERLSLAAPPKNGSFSLAAPQKDGVVTLAAPPPGELQQQHKRRSKNWTRAETVRLIRLRAELEPRFARGGRKSELWDEISESLRRESICRDAQQCRDKWEKLTAGYKEVRDGLRHREDNPFFEELDPLLSVKAGKKPECKDKEPAPPVKDGCQNSAAAAVESEDEETAEDEIKAAAPPLGKRRKVAPTAEMAALRELLESLVSRQQRFFAELLDSMERKEQIREQIRQEKEEKWRAEERAQRCVFHNAMMVLTKKVLEAENTKILEENEGVKLLENGLQASRNRGGMSINPGEAAIFPKRRSKNWKRAEVLQLITVRGEMESRFAQSTRRAALWEEVSELLASQGINRDGKQCREKWDKLMAEYKDVCDGKRDKSESSYFVELTASVGRSGEAG